MKHGTANTILGVVGSPRKRGNTHTLVSRILEGAAAEGAAAETLFLGDLDIRECDGCHICWKGRQCSKKDDMNKIYPKIIQSDIIVFGTPVYWYGPTALRNVSSTVLSTSTVLKTGRQLKASLQ